MRINYSGLITLIFVVTLFQLVINSTTSLYIDCLTIIMVILMLNELFFIQAFILISIFADLIGHWYLGTHLLAVVLVSLLIRNFIRFYRTCHTLQRVILVCIFSSITYIIIMIIDLIGHNNNFSWINLLIDAVVLTPFLIWLSNLLVLRSKPGMILE